MRPSSMEILVHKGPPVNEGGRAWGVVVVICTFFTEKEQMIKQSWDLGRVSFQGDNAANNNGVVTVDRTHQQRADEAFDDPEWWALQWLLFILQGLFANIERFMRSCTCHKATDCEAMYIQAARDSCVMRGCNLFPPCLSRAQRCFQ